MSASDLDGEFLSRLEAARLKDFAALNQTAWFGYRFAHPGHRLMYFIHCYRESYAKTQRLIGKRWVKPVWMKDNPLLHLEKGHFTSLLRACVEADLHGIPYEFYCQKMQEQYLRGTVSGPLSTNQMYGKSFVEGVLAAWVERNEAGIYTAKCEQLHVDNYEGHPIQHAYMGYLCEAVRNKGNKPFYLARLMFDIGHLTPEFATEAFGADAVSRSHDFK